MRISFFHNVCVWMCESWRERERETCFLFFSFKRFDGVACQWAVILQHYIYAHSLTSCRCVLSLSLCRYCANLQCIRIARSILRIKSVRNRHHYFSSIQCIWEQNGTKTDTHTYTHGDIHILILYVSYFVVSLLLHFTLLCTVHAYFFPHWIDLWIFITYFIPIYWYICIPFFESHLIDFLKLTKCHKMCVLNEALVRAGGEIDFEICLVGENANINVSIHIT